MTLKHIVVQLDDAKNATSRYKVAFDLASSHEAHVTGLYVIAPPFVPTYMAGHIGGAFYDNQQRLAEDAATAACDEFDEAAKTAGLSYETMTAEGPPADRVAEVARYADLVIVGQPDPDLVGPADPAMEVPGTVILEAGRPVMVVPYVGALDHVGKSVMVMWNASREATRAIYDALPILTAAQKVSVVSVNPGRGTPDIGDLPGADITHQLARHGIKVEAAPTYANDIDVGDVILSRASDVGADLIVMGGYGRSRFREMILGGATRHLLEHMTVPVLFSH
ncbi:MAG: universal stress protein [Alphaproteobacteria bacterium]|nr:universal stress protein [Alphaproteobacteria bacterium]